MDASQLSSFYINGQWVSPHPGASTFEVVDPTTEQVAGYLPAGTERDVEDAVRAARLAFGGWCESTRDERIALLERVAACYEVHLAEVAEAVSADIGVPIALSKRAQAPVGLAHLRAAIAALREFQFEFPCGKGLVIREPVGVAALITAWNWPLSLMAAKVAAALAAGCTVVLKPSEVAPRSAWIFAQIMHEAGTPKGVFNMVHGDGRRVGTALSSHPDVSMVSITGSTRAGIEVAINAAPTVKRVIQELGGKSPLIILEDADLPQAVKAGVSQVMQNSGQTCVAPTRMLIHSARYAEAVRIAAEAASALVVGNPSDPATEVGPVASRAQYDKVLGMIESGVEAGASIEAGGLERPAGLTRGFYVKPTILANVSNEMAVAREEIFGPVLTMIPYESEDEAIAIANDTPYGLAAYVASESVSHAHHVARRLRAGSVRINGASMDITMPFGGYKASGNGRENGSHGILEFLEHKSIVG